MSYVCVGRKMLHPCHRRRSDEKLAVYSANQKCTEEGAMANKVSLVLTVNFSELDMNRLGSIPILLN